MKSYKYYFRNIYLLNFKLKSVKGQFKFESIPKE